MGRNLIFRVKRRTKKPSILEGLRLNMLSVDVLKHEQLQDSLRQRVIDTPHG